MTLQDSAITGNMKYGTPQIKSKAKYVEPPPKPTLEYNAAVTKNNIANRGIVIYPVTYLWKLI